MATFTFHPRVNLKNMNPAYYDPTYQVPANWETDPSVNGPNIANPYTNVGEYQERYLWGRYHEAINYGNNVRRWRCSTLGRISRRSGSAPPYQWEYNIWSRKWFWYDASELDTTDYHYENDDTEQRAGAALHVGDVRIFQTIGSMQYVTAGIVEIINSINDYYISYVTLQSGSIQFVLEHVINNTIDGKTGRSILSQLYNTSGVDNVVIGREIGWKLPIWMYKKIRERNQRGL